MSLVVGFGCRVTLMVARAAAPVGSRLCTTSAVKNSGTEPAWATPLSEDVRRLGFCYPGMESGLFLETNEHHRLSAVRRQIKFRTDSDTSSTPTSTLRFMLNIGNGSIHNYAWVYDAMLHQQDGRGLDGIFCVDRNPTALAWLRYKLGVILSSNSFRDIEHRLLYSSDSPLTRMPVADRSEALHTIITENYDQSPVALDDPEVLARTQLTLRRIPIIPVSLDLTNRLHCGVFSALMSTHNVELVLANLSNVWSHDETHRSADNLRFFPGFNQSFTFLSTFKRGALMCTWVQPGRYGEAARQLRESRGRDWNVLETSEC